VYKKLLTVVLILSFIFANAVWVFADQSNNDTMKTQTEQKDDQDKEVKKQKLKKEIISNIKKNAEEDMDAVMEMQSQESDVPPPENLEEAADRMSDTFIGLLVTFLMGVEKISGYIMIVCLLIGIPGNFLTRKAPAVRKCFIGLIIIGPVIFILSTYGPVLYYHHVLN
jgi:F0F1-type ATP synthase assembly protein I